MADQTVEEILEWHTRTWYGLPARIVVSSRNLHRVWADGLFLPHFGLVNWVTRQGLPTPVRLELTARHELGHLQTLPVPLLHLLSLGLIWRRGKGPRWWKILLALVAHQAIWELAAEGYVIATDPRAVRYPRPTWAHRLYRIFWGSMALLAAWATYLLSRVGATE